MQACYLIKVRDRGRCSNGHVQRTLPLSICIHPSARVGWLQSLSKPPRQMKKFKCIGTGSKIGMHADIILLCQSIRYQFKEASKSYIRLNSNTARESNGYTSIQTHVTTTHAEWHSPYTFTCCDKANEYIKSP